MIRVVGKDAPRYFHCYETIHRMFNHNSVKQKLKYRIWSSISDCLTGAMQSSGHRTPRKNKSH